MAKNSSRIKIGLKCAECGDINYTTYKNSKTTTEKLNLKNIAQDLKNTQFIKKLS